MHKQVKIRDKIERCFRVKNGAMMTPKCCSILSLIFTWGIIYASKAVCEALMAGLQLIFLWWKYILRAENNEVNKILIRVFIQSTNFLPDLNKQK